MSRVRQYQQRCYTDHGCTSSASVAYCYAWSTGLPATGRAKSMYLVSLVGLGLARCSEARFAAISGNGLLSLSEVSGSCRLRWAARVDLVFLPVLLAGFYQPLINDFTRGNESEPTPITTKRSVRCHEAVEQTSGVHTVFLDLHTSHTRSGTRPDLSIGIILHACDFNAFLACVGSDLGVLFGSTFLPRPSSRLPPKIRL